MAERRKLVRAVADEEAMVDLGRRLGSVLVAGDSVSLTGALGAGKTTLTRGVAEGLGVTAPVSSPTFILARRSPGRRADLLHCDVYRLASAAEFEDIGLDPGGAVTVVEWGRGVMPWLTDGWLDIEIERTRGTRGDARAVTLRDGGTVDETTWKRWRSAA